jgi:hypothetical protein
VEHKPVERLSDTDLNDLLQEIRGGSSDERRAALRNFDWSKGDLRKLGWSMSQKGLDLGTAMIVFFNGHPGRYNYLRKDNVPLDARERCQVLDAIHRRVVSGFYLPDPDRGLGDVFAHILEWVERQEEDRAKGRHGRWVFDPTLFTPITLQAVRAESDEDADARIDKPCERDALDRSIFMDTARPRRNSLLRDLLSPILG